MAGKNLNKPLKYILFFAGLVSILLLVVFFSLPVIRGTLAAIAWVMVFVLAEISTKSAENRRQSESDEKERLESVNRIQSGVARINEKALALNDSYSGEKKALSEMLSNVKVLLPSTDLDASKMEYEILTGLTRLDFLCDKAVAGTDRSGDFKNAIRSLSSLVRQREKL